MKHCKVCGIAIMGSPRQLYCSVKCRNKTQATYWREWQRARAKKEALNPEGKIQCEVCGLWYKRVGLHVYNAHKITAKEYRKEYGFDVKRGQLTKEDRKVMRNHTKTNGTIKNLEAGKKFRFKKGEHGVGVYERSEQTLERLKNLFKFNKK